MRFAQEAVAARVGCSIVEARRLIEQLARKGELPVATVIDDVLAGQIQFDRTAVS